MCKFAMERNDYTRFWTHADLVIFNEKLATAGKRVASNRHT
jgi:hypothetical protein